MLMRLPEIFISPLVLSDRADGRLVPRNLRPFCENREHALVRAVVAADIFFHPILKFLQGFTLGLRFHPVIEIRVADRLDPKFPLCLHSNLPPLR